VHARKPGNLNAYHKSVVRTRARKVKQQGKPFFQHALISSFPFIVRELDLILTRLLVVCITCIATPCQLEPIDEHEVTSTRHMENRTRDLGSLLVQRKFIVKLDLIKRLVSRSEGLVNL